jgi:hypothetical protein
MPSTTITTPSAPVGAAPTGQTTAPELQDAELAHQQTVDDADADDQSPGSQAGQQDKGLTEEQKTIRKQQRRIDRLTARAGGAAREVELTRGELQQLRERMQQLEAGSTGDDKAAQRPQPALTQKDVDRIANERAQDMLRHSTIASGLGKVFQAGAKLEGFKQAVDALGDEIPLVDRQGRATPFVEAVLECDDAAGVMHYLGNNPEEAADLADLSPAQLGRRLTKLEIRLKQDAKQQTSSAPPPLKGVTPKSAPSKSLLDLSADEYAKARRKQLYGT